MLVNRPYEEDFFQRIVNVKWTGGAIFATGNFAGVSYFKAVSNAASRSFRNIGLLGFSNEGITSASSYAVVSDPAGQMRPTFLIGGDKGPDPITGERGGLIYVSNDGLSWSEVYNESRRVVNQLVWDKKEQHFFADVSDSTVGHKSVCWSSSDGHNWLEAGGSFISHCEFGLADGQFGYDEEKKLFKSAASLHANAVTFAGGVWAKAEEETIAGGLVNNRLLQISFDSCKTWIAAGYIPDDQSQIVTICGGPLADQVGL